MGQIYEHEARTSIPRFAFAPGFHQLYPNLNQFHSGRFDSAPTTPAPEASVAAPAPEGASATVSAPAASVGDSGKGGTANSSPAGDNRGPLTLEQELPAAIAFLARMANMNIQFDPSLVFTNGVPGPDGRMSAPIVSLRWENVTAEDALQEVLDNHSLMLVVNPKSGVGRVVRKPTELPLVTTVVQLRYASPTNIIDVIKPTFTDRRSRLSADLRTSQTGAGGD
ncbi:MAG: hypothetical protein U1G07_20240 [Verrucomicrobiota bacterium]